MNLFQRMWKKMTDPAKRSDPQEVPTSNVPRRDTMAEVPAQPEAEEPQVPAQDVPTQEAPPADPPTPEVPADPPAPEAPADPPADPAPVVEEPLTPRAAFDAFMAANADLTAAETTASSADADVAEARKNLDAAQARSIEQSASVGDAQLQRREAGLALIAAIQTLIGE